MKKLTALTGGLTSFIALSALGNADQIRPVPAPRTLPQPPPVYQVAPGTPATPTPSAPQLIYVYDQKPLPEQPALIAPAEAQGIVDRFRTNYPKLESARILIYVNRDLVDEKSGLKLSARSEVVETAKPGVSNQSASNNPAARATVSKSVVKNNYRNNEASAPTLADKQTVRDVERLMGRPLRLAGAALVDQRVATQTLRGKPLKAQAEKDREAIRKIADVVLEVLISSRNLTVSEVSGDTVYTVPDIQATAIRLKDSKIIGQASAADVLSRNPGYTARNFGVQEITEATALALMDDIVRNVQ